MAITSLENYLFLSVLLIASLMATMPAEPTIKSSQEGILIPFNIRIASTNKKPAIKLVLWPSNNFQIALNIIFPFKMIAGQGDRRL